MASKKKLAAAAVAVYLIVKLVTTDVDLVTAAADPAAVSRGGNRVFRGGGFTYPAAWSRSALRSWGSPGSWNQDRGFRVVLPAPELVDAGS